MRIISLDASTSCTGYAVFDGDNLIAHGKIKPHGDDWRDRIMDETMALADLFRQYKPNVIICEDVPKKPGYTAEINRPTTLFNAPHASRFLSFEFHASPLNP